MYCSMVPDMDTLALLGEVRTCLLPDSGSLPHATVVELLSIVPGRPVVSRARPVALASSPAIATGVDCKLATAATRSSPRAVGTVTSHAVVVGGRILQSSARTRVVQAAERRRQPWSHYLSQVGVTEIVSKSGDGVDLSDGYLSGAATAETLDLASIGERLLSRIRIDPRLDQNVPLQAVTTRLRWIARVGAVDSPRVAFRLEDDVIRTVRVVVGDEADLDAAQRFCEDLAVHDWLLSTTGTAIEEADRFPSAGQEAAEVLAPILEHLVHLWMPGAHTPQAMRHLWDQLEIDPGFTRQWDARVGHLRDRMTVATLDALRRTRITTTDW